MTSRLETTAAETLDSFWRHLEKGHLNRSVAVLRELGYSALAVDYALTKDSYYIPEHLDGRLVRPHDINDDAIPVVALERNHDYEFEEPVLHSLQYAALQARGIDTGAMTDVLAAVNETSVSSVQNGSNPASVYRRLLPHAQAGLVESRPVVIFNPDFQATPVEPMCPSATLHEFVHIAQSLTDPIWDESKRLQKELEAYAVQAELVSSYQVEYSLAMAMAGQVNLHRQRHLGPHGYEPSREFIDFARYDDVLQKILKAN